MSAIPDGTYTGTFQRKTSTGGAISNITMTFSGSSWSGTGDSTLYPGLCNGTYSQKGLVKVNFVNGCGWVLYLYDESFILDGDYTLSVDGKHVEITRSYDGGYEDVYELTRQ